MLKCLLVSLFLREKLRGVPIVLQQIPFLVLNKVTKSLECRHSVQIATIVGIFE